MKREGKMRRREVIKAGLAAGALGALQSKRARAEGNPRARLALAPVSFRDWFEKTPSFATSGRPSARRLTLLELPAFVADEFELPNAELWSYYFDDESDAYCRALARAARKAKVGVCNLQLDAIGADLAATDEGERVKSIDVVKSWMDRAVLLGCPRVRANTDEFVPDRPFDPDLIADSFRRLAVYGAKIGVDIFIENHTGYSASISNVIAIHERVGHPRCKLLADWGNSAAKSTEARIADLSLMFPHLALVSAKGRKFDADYRHVSYEIAPIVRATEASGYRGIYSIELFTASDDMPADPIRAARAMIGAITPHLLSA